MAKKTTIDFETFQSAIRIAFLFKLWCARIVSLFQCKISSFCSSSFSPNLSCIFGIYFLNSTFNLLTFSLIAFDFRISTFWKMQTCYYNWSGYRLVFRFDTKITAIHLCPLFSHLSHASPKKLTLPPIHPILTSTTMFMFINSNRWQTVFDFKLFPW